MIVTRNVSRKGLTKNVVETNKNSKAQDLLLTVPINNQKDMTSTFGKLPTHTPKQALTPLTHHSPLRHQ